MLWTKEDSVIYSLSLCHQKGTLFHKYYKNLSEALVEQNASQYLLSKLMI